jgi:pyruvate,water dikinase
VAQLVIPLDQVGLDDIELVGGKNASLGEMLTHLTAAGVKVPGGFATTSHAFREFLTADQLAERIEAELSDLDVNDLDKLSATGARIRGWILETALLPELESAISAAWEDLSAGQSPDFSVAVRSSATAEDLPDASFAGQQETILNVVGLAQLLSAIRTVFASL